MTGSTFARAAVAASAILAASSALAGGRAFTIADHYRVVGVADPQVSADGTRIAFLTTHTDLPAAKRWSDLVVAGIDGADARDLTTGKRSNSAPRWAPDGSTLAYVSSDASGTPQIFLMPMDGGEPRQLTSFSMGVAAPVWSPDGRFMAFASDVYPECGADSACNEKISRTWREGALEAHMADRLLYRHWTSWRDGRYAHVILVNVADGTLHDLTPGSFDAPTFSLGGEAGFAFAPDSRELVFVSNHDPDPASSTNADLWTVAIAEDGTPGEPVDITGDSPAWDGSPAYSPDGRFIAYRTQAVPGYESDLFRIALYDRAARTHKVLTESFRNWIDAFQWAPDSRRIVYQAEVEGRTPLYDLDVATGAARQIIVDATIDSWQLTPDGNGIVYARRSVAEPGELFRVGRDGTGRVRLTHYNDALLAEVDFRPAEEMWVKGAGGHPVHVFIVKPHGFDPAKKYPLILNVHGGPQSQWGDSYRGDWQVYPGVGYVVAFANPHGSTGYGQEYTAAISHDWGGAVYDDLMKVTDALAKLPYVNAKKMGAMGWSYGGYMMMWFEGHTDRFAAIASMMGVYDLRAMYSATEELWFPHYDLGGVPWESREYRTWSPSEYVKNFVTPCQVITGEQDFRVPYTQSLEFFTDLQKMKVPSRLIVFSKAGHWPSWYEMAFYYDAHVDWFHRWLGGGAAPWDPEAFLRNQVFEKAPEK